MEELPFSYEEILSQSDVYIPDPKYVTASDGIRIAFREYICDNPKAGLIFYHGAGAHSGLSYPVLANELCKSFDINVFTPDMRGHGYSDGDRGHAPSPARIYDDVADFIKEKESVLKGRPLYLGGHSGGVGLTLNYAKNRNVENINGYVFLAPYLGYKSKTANPDVNKRFTSVKIPLFILNAMFRICGNKKAVFYNLPESLTSPNKMVTSISVNMANAITPSNPHKQISHLKRKIGIWIGENDEIFNPDKIENIFISNNSLSDFIKIPNANHLSSILSSSQYIGKWILNILVRVFVVRQVVKQMDFEQVCGVRACFL